MPSTTDRKSNFRIDPKFASLLFIVPASIIALFRRCPTNSDQLIINLLAGLGIALLLAKSGEKSKAKFSIGNLNVVLSGSVVIPFVLIMTNPVGAYKGDACRLFNTNVTVIVQAKEGSQDVTLRNKGEVVMEVIHKETKRSPVNGYGQAFFQNLMIGDSVRLNIDFSEPYRSVHPDSVYIIKTNDNIDLKVKLQGLDTVLGNVNYDNVALLGVAVQLEGKNGELHTVTDDRGNFNFKVPLAMQQKEYTVVFVKKGFLTRRDQVYPETGESVDVTLEKR